MTQMNLADAMEVSYQAVSNWERGNSMPDISKLEQLCGILHLTMEELLGSDHVSQTINKIISPKDSRVTICTVSDAAADVNINTASNVTPDDGLNTASRITPDNNINAAPNLITIEELQTIAPLLPPSRIEKLVDDSLQQQTDTELKQKALMKLAPFLDAEYLDKLVQEADLETDRKFIVSLAPFLSRNTLRKLADSILQAED